MKTVEKVREVKMYFYQAGHQGQLQFKVWQAAGGGWWVDQLDRWGETDKTLQFAETVAEAEDYMDVYAAHALLAVAA